MQGLLLLMGLPLVFSLITFFISDQKIRGVVVRIGSVAVMFTSIVFVAVQFNDIMIVDLSEYAWIKYMMLLIEIIVAAYILWVGMKHRKYLVIVFSCVQICLMIWFEFTEAHHIQTSQSIYIDKLSILMIAIIGIIGSFICIYAVEYMKEYHHHHSEFQDRQRMFFMVLFLFMSAMFGVVICNDMVMMLFFWEITSLCSFLLIGYTKTEEAIINSFTAITINVFGGLCFAVGIVIMGIGYKVLDFNSMLELGSSTPAITGAVFLIACAGLTKSAQMPFSKWLLGAMVAPTPTSAMLHSSTMVKAGVYLIIRLAPMLGANAAGISITLVGGVTFFVTAVLAVSKTDAKKILAYSTISNLGLIVACAAIDTAEALWAAIMLIVFHAIAKSLLFLSVGSTEHQLGSRNVEDMDGLFRISRTLTMLLVIGIAGMFVAPFGMLISKWAAMKAFVDSNNIILIMLVAYGSTLTLFFWTKWMGKLIANAHRKSPTSYIMRNDEKVSLYTLAAMVVGVCVVHPIISSEIIIPYIDSNLHISFNSPIDPISTTIIILMMCVLFILPVILIPFYRNHRVKSTSTYLAGENTGDDESFYGSMGEVRQLELRNWYMKDIVKESKYLHISYLICALLLVAGFCATIGGGVFF